MEEELKPKRSGRLAAKPTKTYNVKAYASANRDEITQLHVQTPEQNHILLSAIDPRIREPHKLDVTPQNDVYVLELNMPPQHYLGRNVQLIDASTQCQSCERCYTYGM